MELANKVDLTIAEIFAAYKADLEKEGKDTRKQGWTWTILAPTFGKLKPKDLVNPVMVDGKELTVCHQFAFEQEAKGLARDTIWDRLSTLRTALNWAHNREILPERTYVWVPQKGDPRDIPLSEEEYLKILDSAIESHIRLFLLIVGCTGARKTAILQLTWDRVDLDRRIIDFRVGKKNKGILNKRGAKGRSVVEFGVALELALREQKEIARTDHVIEWAGDPVKDVKKGLSAAIKRAGIQQKGLGAHAIRHMVATELADQNIDMRKIQKMLGHKNLKTTEEIYAKHRRGYLTDAANVIDLKFAGKKVG